MPDFTKMVDLTAVGIPYFQTMVVLLLACLIIVPVLERLRVSPVLGYLAAGIVIGPFGMGLVHESNGMETLAELGVVFLLFMIGLHMSVEKLFQMRRLVFGLGVLQVLITGVVIGLIALAWENSVEVTILLGLSFALSSTAIVSKILIDGDELNSKKGKLALAILLAQDLAVVPLLVMVKVFSESGNDSLPAELGMAAVKAVAAILFIFTVGRFLLRPVSRHLRKSVKNPEIPVALALLTVFVSAAFTSAFGLSMELGAFMAGIMIAETQFKERIEKDIAPFQGLLLGLFFITVGMQIDVTAVMKSIGWLLLSVVGIFSIKSCIIFGLSRAFGFENKVALPAALMLGQGGEFLFVIVGSAKQTGLIPEDVGHFMMLVTTLTMIVTPLYALAAARIEKYLEKK